MSVEMRIFLFFIAIVAIVIFLQQIDRKKIIEKGLYTKCTIINSEGSKSGRILTIQYSFNRKNMNVG